MFITWGCGWPADMPVAWQSLSDHDRAGEDRGQPCIRGHRFTVEHLLSLAGSGWSLEEIQEDFPFVEAADIQQAIAYASFSVREYHLPISRSAELARLLVDALGSGLAEMLPAGVIASLTPDRVRVRPLPLRPATSAEQ